MKGSLPLALLGLVLLSQCLCTSKRKAPTEAADPSLESVEPNITFLRSANRAYNQDKWNPIIARIIKELENEPSCESAFNQAGIDLKQLLANGIIIASTDVMGRSTAEALTLTEPAKMSGQQLVDDWNVPAFTTTNFSG